MSPTVSFQCRISSYFPGCNKSHIGKTERCHKTRLYEHATQHETSVIVQHFLESQKAQNITYHNNSTLDHKIFFEKPNSNIT